MAITNETSFEDLALLLNTGDVTVAEILNLPYSKLTTLEKQALVFHASNVIVANLNNAESVTE